MKTVLGELIEEHLDARDMLRAELADALGITPVSVSKWLNGRDLVPWHHYVQLAEILRVPLQKILTAARADSPAHVERFHRFYRPVGK